MPIPLGHIYSYFLRVGHPPQQDGPSNRAHIQPMITHTDKERCIIIILKIIFTYEPL